jgi:hypothetical protein
LATNPKSIYTIIGKKCAKKLYRIGLGLNAMKSFYFSLMLGLSQARGFLVVISTNLIFALNKRFKNSISAKCLSAKCLSAKCLSSKRMLAKRLLAKCLMAKCPSAECWPNAGQPNA